MLLRTSRRTPSQAQRTFHAEAAENRSARPASRPQALPGPIAREGPLALGHHPINAFQRLGSSVYRSKPLWRHQARFLTSAASAPAPTPASPPPAVDTMTEAGKVNPDVEKYLPKEIVEKFLIQLDDTKEVIEKKSALASTELYKAMNRAMVRKDFKAATLIWDAFAHNTVTPGPKAYTQAVKTQLQLGNSHRAFDLLREMRYRQKTLPPALLGDVLEDIAARVHTKRRRLFGIYLSEYVLADVLRWNISIPHSARTWLMRALAVSNQQQAAFKEFAELQVANPPCVFHPEALLDLIESFGALPDFPADKVREALNTSLEFADSMRSQDLTGGSTEEHRKQFWTAVAVCWARIGELAGVQQALARLQDGGQMNKKVLANVARAFAEEKQVAPLESLAKNYQIDHYIQYYLLAVAKTSSNTAPVFAAATEFGIAKLGPADFELVFDYYCSTKQIPKENIRSLHSFLDLHQFKPTPVILQSLVKVHFPDRHYSIVLGRYNQFKKEKTPMTPAFLSTFLKAHWDTRLDCKGLVDEIQKAIPQESKRRDIITNALEDFIVAGGRVSNLVDFVQHFPASLREEDVAILGLQVNNIDALCFFVERSVTQKGRASPTLIRRVVAQISAPGQSYRTITQLFDVTWPYRGLWHQQMEQVVQVLLKFKDVWRINNVVWDATRRNEPWVEAVKAQLVAIRDDLRVKKEVEEEKRKKEEEDRQVAHHQGLLRMADIIEEFSQSKHDKSKAPK